MHIGFAKLITDKMTRAINGESAVEAKSGDSNVRSGSSRTIIGERRSRHDILSKGVSELENRVQRVEQAPGSCFNRLERRARDRSMLTSISAHKRQDSTRSRSAVVEFEKQAFTMLQCSTSKPHEQESRCRWSTELVRRERHSKCSDPADAILAVERPQLRSVTLEPWRWYRAAT